MKVSKLREVPYNEETRYKYIYLVKNQFGLFASFCECLLFQYELISITTLISA